MKTEFTKAKCIVDDGIAYLCIAMPYQMAVKFISGMKLKKYILEIKEWRARRSLDANAYFWVLVDRLANKLNLQKTEIYRGYIREIGGNSETVCVVEAAADKLCQGWSHNGLGWVAEKVPSKLPGCVNVVLYYGSSTYDTAQMSRLIHLAVEDCKALGIETMTPAELARLLEGWE